MLKELGIFFDSSIQKDFEKQPKNHKVIMLYHNPLKSEEFRFDQLIDFLEIFPNFFICSKCASMEDVIIRFNVCCSICNQINFFVSLKIFGQSSNIYFSTKCDHIIITEVSREGIYKTNKVDIFPRLFNNQFHTRHPLRVIGKTMYRKSQCSDVVKSYLETKIFSDSYIRRLKDKQNNIVDLYNFLLSISGFVQIRLLKENNLQNLLIYDDTCVQSLSWIAPWTIEVLKYVSNVNPYYEVDASFLALKPYVYFVPMLIIQNASLPLGIVLGPSEHQNLFLEFFDFLEALSFNFNFFPVLSD